MKFILLSQETERDLVLLIPVIFSDILVHKSVFEINQMLLREMYQKNGWKEATCISAGFYRLDTGVCYGESESLKISCRKGTTEIIQNINYISIFTKTHPFLCSETK